MKDKVLAHAHPQGPSSVSSAQREPRPLTDERCAAPSRYFPADLVVSRTVSGDVASRFADDAWDMSHMATDATSTLVMYFYKSGEPAVSELALLIRQQQKALMWLHMDAGKERAWATLRNTNSALTQWCAWADDQGTDLFTLLSDPQAVAERSQELNTNYVQLTATAIQTLWRHRERLGARVDMRLKELRETLARESASRGDTRQTPLIPSRVYLSILAALDRDMDRIEAELDKVLAAYATERLVSRETPAGLTHYHRQVHRARRLKGVVQDMGALGYEPKAKVSGPG